MQLKKFVLFLCLIYSGVLFSQGASCSVAEPFCSTDGNGQIIFENVSGNSSAEAGPNYGCLLEQPNPSWYFLKIDDDGDLNLRISQNTRADGTGIGLDVDFIIWGPFDTSTECDPSNLSQANTIACSFSEDSVERFSIANAVNGEFYMLLITNFSGIPGFITMNQTGGVGSTDCSIVAGSLGADQFPCEDETVILDGTTNSAVAYEWFLDDVIIPNENEATLEVTVSGTYTIEVSNAEGSTDSDEVEVTFVTIPVPIAPMAFDICFDDEEIENPYLFDLSEYNARVLGEADPSIYRVSYHETQSEADTASNSVTTSFTNAADTIPERIFIRVESRLKPSCFKTTSAPIAVNLVPDFDLGDNLGICSDVQGNLINTAVIESGLASEKYRFEWFLNDELLPNESENTLTTNLAGQYALLVTDSATGCQNSDTIEVMLSSPPITFSAENVTPTFSENNRIEVSVTGQGAYEFSIDNGPFQESSIFENIRPGDHIITIQDKFGCGSVELDISIMDFPRFFTPNGDLVNDTWQIPESDTVSDINIRIFSRTGEFISQITPQSPGWDGIFNGQRMPSSDYWFVASFTENEQRRSFRGHFSLKR